MRLQVTPNWYSLGLELGLTQHALDVIEEDNGRDSNTCKRKMFSKWLLNNEDASYTSIVDALIAIGNNGVAEEVSQKFCELHSLLNVDIHAYYITRIIKSLKFKNRVQIDHCYKNYGNKLRCSTYSKTG